MHTREIYMKILGRIKFHSDQIYQFLNEKMQVKLSRAKAHSLRVEILREKKKSVVDANLRKEIKKYCGERFGSESYWPWLALYTEIRGEFKKGWIPQDYYRFQLLKKYNVDSFSLISINKSFDIKLFNGFYVTPLVSRISNIYYDSNFKRINKARAESILSEHNNEVVIKKDEGRGGSDVSFIQSGVISLPNGKDNQNFVIQPLIRQCKVFDSIHPESVNTLRVFTYLNAEGKAVELYTLLRFGRGNTRVDHAGAGGGFCYVSKNGDVDPYCYDNLGRKLSDRHPDTDVKFADIKIPSYHFAIQKCMAAHESYPYVKFIGWDLTIDENNTPVLLEWNARHPGFWLKEALFGPFLQEDIE